MVCGGGDGAGRRQRLAGHRHRRRNQSHRARRGRRPRPQGVSPIEYSSGGRSTRRLNHDGDRPANAALHRIVFTRLRHDPRAQAYYERKTRHGRRRVRRWPGGRR
ncbi:transposase [Streptomyces sp. NPDC001852]|uniref:transposase n=1 Tax=Streptomyces sp. NPDC001852 TaxID=3364619 RepID=UPI0036D0CD27